MIEPRNPRVADPHSQTDEAPTLPLHGVKVLDLSSVLLGSYCTRILAQMGADVIKVENLQGDIARRLGSGRTAEMSPMFLNLNRGKRSIAIDLKSEQGRALLPRIVAGADVLVHNLRPESAKRLGIDAAAVQQINRRIVSCAVVGYGSDGPYRDLPAYDDIIQAAGGLAATQSVVTGTNSYMASAVADKVTGLYAGMAVLAALRQAQAQERAVAVEVPMFESVVDFHLVEHLGGLTHEPPSGEALYERTRSPNRRPFSCADGHIAVMVYTDPQWDAFLTRVGRRDLLADPRFASITVRSANTTYVYGMLEEILVKKPRAHWLGLFRELDIPAGPVNSVEELLTNEHLCAVDMFRMVDHPDEGNIREIRSPIRLDGRRAYSSSLAPGVGQDSVEILRQHGLGDAEIAAMISDGVVRQGEEANGRSASGARRSPT